MKDKHFFCLFAFLNVTIPKRKKKKLQNKTMIYPILIYDLKWHEVYSQDCFYLIFIWYLAVLFCP